MAKYLEKNSNLIQNKSCIELGSGTGLTGIAASQLGAQSVLLTDYYDLNLLEKNVKENTSSNTSVKSLEWSKGTNDFGKFDVILGSDIIYDSFILVSLYDTILSLSHEKTQVFLSCDDHWPLLIKKFMDLASKDFYVKKVIYKFLLKLSYNTLGS